MSIYIYIYIYMGTDILRNYMPKREGGGRSRKLAGSKWCGTRDGMTPRRTSARYGWKDQKKNGGLARNWASCEGISFRDTLHHPMTRWVLGVWGQDLSGWTDRGVVANE